MGHDEISREALRDYAASLTRLGIMNFRFRGPGLPGDHHHMIHMVYFDPQPDCSSDQDDGNLPPVRSIVAAVATIPWNDNDPEDTERARKAARTNREAHEMWEFLHPPSPSWVPHPGWVHRDNLQSCISLNPDGIIIASDLVTMAFGRNEPKPDCFNQYTLDNHADICIFCNAGLLTNIYSSEFRVNGIVGNSNIQFDQVGDHPYCGTVIYVPKNRYNLITIRIIKDKGHRRRQYIRCNNGQRQPKLTFTKSKPITRSTSLRRQHTRQKNATSLYPMPSLTWANNDTRQQCTSRQSRAAQTGSLASCPQCT